MISLISFALIGSMSYFRFSIADLKIPFANPTIGNWQLEIGHIYPAIFSFISCKWFRTEPS